MMVMPTEFDIEATECLDTCTHAAESR